MAITLADFNKIWASTSPLTPYSFSESNYKQGWNFIGSTPPARQMWDYLQKNNDEKMQYLANNYLPLSGGTMSGTIVSNNGITIRNETDTAAIRIQGGINSNHGAALLLTGKDNSAFSGSFVLQAHDGTNYKNLTGVSDGTLKWDGKEVERVNSKNVGTTGYIRFESGLQICWEQKSSVTTTPIAVVYPVPFNVTPKVVACSTINAVTVCINDVTNTGFNAFTESSNTIMYYIAIGSWK